MKTLELRSSTLSSLGEPASAVLVLLALALVLSGCSRSDSAAAPQADTTAGAPAKKAKFFCPMHPTYTSDRQGDCPICNMKLVPMKEGAVTLADTNTPAVPGRVTVMIAPEKQQLIGLKTALVEERELSTTIQATATVRHDETRFARIAPRFGGWVSKLHLNFTGAPVEKGQPLLTVYSPELLAAESEYLIAWRAARERHEPTAERLLASARRKLELWQIGDEEIRALEQRGEPSEELLLRAPFSGHVLTKTAVEGKAFMAGETLFEIADLKHLWVLLSIAEADFPFVQEGQRVWLEFPQQNNRSYDTTIRFLGPHLDPQTRRGEARLEIENTDHALRADMWGQAEIETSLGKHLTVPASAVIDTGRRFVAFVLRQDNHLEPRELKVGAKTDDWWEVLSGVKAGEKVVTRALFLVDSESQLKAAISGMGGDSEHQH